MGTAEDKSIFASSLDLLDLDTVELQSLFAADKLTSAQLVRACLEQIRNHDQKGLELHAMIATAPEADLIEIADDLDRERKAGLIRGPLHGIPIIVKDCIATDPQLKMKTTCGNHALARSIVSGDARVVEKLRRAGMIILGKANLTEFCQMKGENITTGWSAVGGQTVSPYITGGIRHDQGPGGPSMAGGSSTGSAVGVAAGYSPLALGTETDGSTIQPANRAALFAIKPTHGIVSVEGVWQLSTSFDVIGPMAKSASDLANLMDIIVEDDDANYSRFLTKSFADLKLGFVDPDIWQFSDAYSCPIEGVREQMKAAYLDAFSKIQSLAAKVKYPVEIPQPEELDIAGKSSFFTVITYEYGALTDTYLANLVESEVRTLDELIKWNEAHPELELPHDYPSQLRLIAARDQVPSHADYSAVKSHLETVTVRLSAVFESHDIDLIVVPTDSRMCSLASTSGFPIGTMPLGYLNYNGKPFGLAVVGKSGHDGRLIEFMSAFEAAFPKRLHPQPLIERLTRDYESRP